MNTRGRLIQSSNHLFIYQLICSFVHILTVSLTDVPGEIEWMLHEMFVNI